MPKVAVGWQYMKFIMVAYRFCDNFSILSFLNQRHVVDVKGFYKPVNVFSTVFKLFKLPPLPLPNFPGSQCLNFGSAPGCTVLIKDKRGILAQISNKSSQ